MTVSIPEATLRELENRNVVARVWQRDHTLWKPDPTEITNRLGWLTVADEMQGNLPALEAFFQEVRDAGYRDVVLLGMGGSSLGAEVLRCSLPPREGAPRLSVLDSTVPGWVHGVEQSIDLKSTLFLVSSKSGGTVETLSLYRYFRARVEEVAGAEDAGSHFVAITDDNTPLHRMAKETGFRRAFLNLPDVGGRYSVLSYFGLVPAALAGLDVAAVLERARSMARRCGPDVPLRENPGALLGAALGAYVLAGRDKATIVASPSIRTFGLWAEQLLGESTGKEATGIVPIADEPLAAPDAYPNDRFFVYLRLDGDDNAAIDAAIAAIEAAGHPVERLALSDPKDVAAEFFRWEFATAVAGALLGINPFDQPNVQQAKEATAQVLRDYEATATLPTIASSESLSDLLAQAEPGDYLAIMAYVPQDGPTDRAIDELRRTVLERHRIATMTCYGPRYLHSTGQLHKRGPNSGLYLQIVAPHPVDLPVPGQPYTFSVLAEAQALGDLQVLQAIGRRAIRIELTGDPASGIRSLTDSLR